MKRAEIAKRMARVSGVSPGEAADRLDRVVHDILCRLRLGKGASLPGLGSFIPQRNGRVTFRPEGGDRHE